MDPWQEPKTLATYLVVVLVFVFILIAAIILAVRVSLNKKNESKENAAKLKLEHQQKLLENSIQTQERERARIAAEIHDELIGKLTAIKMTYQLNKNATEIEDLLSNSIQIARNISHDLMPPLIEYASLDEIVKETILPWQNHIKTNTRYTVSGTFEVSSEIKIHLIRILQEIYVNIHKHAKANLVSFHLRITSQWIAMTINDNGIGFDTSAIKNGLGLFNIETRVQYMKGSFKIKSKPNQGTAYIFLIPNQKDQIL